MRPARLLLVAAQITVGSALVAGGLIVWTIPYHYSRALGIAFELIRSDARYVVIGDSITAIASPATVCGKPAINAGIPNYTTEDYGSALAIFRPLLGERRVFVALGTNDTWPGAPSYAGFGRAYGKLLQRLGGRVEAVVLVPPARYGVRYPDRTRRDRVNAIITALANAARIPIVLVTTMSTTDGVHPNARGTVQWQAALRSACSASSRSVET